MKKNFLILVTVFSMSSCIWVPIKMTPYQSRLWHHQNSPREYYYKKYPRYQERVKPGKIYKPYFRNGRW